MRLAFCLYQYFPHSGLARDMLRIAREAASRGHHVDLYARAWRGEAPRELSVTLLDGGGLSNHGRAARFVRRLRATLGDAGYDAVVAFNKIPGADFHFAADGCFAARARRRYPRAYELTPRYRTSRRLEAGVFGFGAATRIMFLSERQRLEYQAYYATAPQRTRLLPPILDRVHQRGPLEAGRRAALREALGAGANDRLLLQVGSGFRTKGVDRSLRALAALPDGIRHRVRLAIAGQGRARHYEPLIRRLGVGGQVTFLGGRDDVPELLRAADLLLHPAREESAGAVLLEALAAGLPVITTASCGYAGHVSEAGAGLVLEAPFRQQALDRALRRLASGAERERLSANARRYGRDEALYRMPGTAVDLIEHWDGDAPVPGFRGCVHPELGGLMAERPRLQDWLDIPGKVYRQTRDRKTLCFAHHGRRYFLKAHYGVGWREIGKNLALLKWPVLGADNEWLALHYLQVLGIPTMTAVAFGRGPGLARRRSFLVTRELAGMVNLETPAARRQAGGPAGGRRRARLIEQIAAIIRTLHDNGINHRDFYLCHLLFDPASADSDDPALHVIDLHRAQVRHRTPRRWRLKDLGGLYYSALDAGLTGRERLRFVRAYTGQPLRRALADRRFWRRVESRATSLRRAEQRRGHADASGLPRDPS